MKDCVKDFSNRRFGIFNHFLFGKPGSSIENAGERNAEAALWNRRCDLFDVERVAYDLDRIGAGYYFITVMQGYRFMLSPNETFDRICNTKPGECCAKRDVIAELITALDKYGIALGLYFTGDGPYKDEYCTKYMGHVNQEKGVVNEVFLKNWSSVLEEYAVRYGDGVKAWWIDGCYDTSIGSKLGYTKEHLKYYYNAIKKGNPNALIACNNGIREKLYKWGDGDEMTSGEYNDFSHVPTSSDVDGALPHFLIPLGINKERPGHGGWGMGGCAINRDNLKKYVDYVNGYGGVLTLDIAIDHESNFDPEQLEMLIGIMDK